MRGERGREREIGAQSQGHICVISRTCLSTPSIGGIFMNEEDAGVPHVI